MYRISDEQIDFILDDIRRRGIEMEDLQLNLLDHICCIIEQNLSQDGDFEDFYKKTIPKFFKHGLWEIEEETINLLIFKHYYTMKKIMIYSGAIASALVFIGLVLKFLHLPGASMGIVLGIGLFSLLFLPVLLVMKIREKVQVREKVAIIVGTISGIALSLGTLFKIMHWPFANVMSMGAVLSLVLVFVPIYLLNGIRNSETKVNTIVTSVLIFCACGLLFTLMRSPKGTFLLDKQLTENYLLNDQILKKEIKQAELSQTSSEAKAIIEQCEKIKNAFIESETGSKNLQHDFSSSQLVVNDHTILGGFLMPAIQTQSEELQKLCSNYDKSLGKSSIPLNFTLHHPDPEVNSISTFVMLDRMNQIERTVLYNERVKLVASK